MCLLCVDGRFLQIHSHMHLSPTYLALPHTLTIPKFIITYKILNNFTDYFIIAC